MCNFTSIYSIFVLRYTHYQFNQNTMDETQVTPGVGTEPTQTDPQVPTSAPEATEGEVVEAQPEAPTEETPA